MTVAQQGLSRIGDDLMGDFDLSGGRGIESQILSTGRRRSLADVVSLTDTAGAEAARSFDTAEGVLARQQRAIGSPMDARTQGSQDRRLGLARALSSVDSRNRALQAEAGRRDVARTTASSLRDMVDQQALKAAGEAASLEGGRQIEHEQAKAEHAAQKAAGLGQIAGMAMSFIPGGQFFAPMVAGAQR